MNSNFENNQVNRLIMISNARGSHLFAKYGRDESPVFKIKAVQNDFGKSKLHLTVMEVIYPRDLYRELDARAAVLMAIKDGMVVVRETDTMITFVPEMGQRTQTVDIPEVDCECCKLRVESPVYVKGDCSQPIRGRVDVDGNCPARNLFYVCQKPCHGGLEVDRETGEWVYQSKCEDAEKDTFEIVVWNVSGGWTTQRTVIACQPQPEVIDVNILTTPLTIVAEYPIDVNVATLPPVVVRTEGEALAVDVVSMASVTIDGAVEVTGLNVEVPGTMTVTTAADDALAVSVSGVASVTIEGVVEVTGVEIPDVITVTTAVDDALVVSVSGVASVTIDGVVEVTGIEINIPEIIMVTTVPDDSLSVEINIPEIIMVTTVPDDSLSVSVSGIPSVTVAGAVVVTVPDIEIPEVMMVTTIPDQSLSVSVAGVASVTVPGVVEVTVSGPRIFGASYENIPPLQPNGGWYKVLFDTAHSYAQTIYIENPNYLPIQTQLMVSRCPSINCACFLGEPTRGNSNFAFHNDTPASYVGVIVINECPDQPLENLVIAMESHEPVRNPEL